MDKTEATPRPDPTALAALLAAVLALVAVVVLWVEFREVRREVETTLADFDVQRGSLQVRIQHLADDQIRTAGEIHHVQTWLKQNTGRPGSPIGQAPPIPPN